MVGNNSRDKESLTSKELLIRIDERQQNILLDIREIKLVLSGKVNEDDDYRVMKDRVNRLWDFKNKVVGYGAAAGAIAGIVINLLDRFLPLEF